jgi:folate-dependent phosphoribosylglycinamide formyltransferase PurN
MERKTMALTPLFEPGQKGRPMRVAGFMSGSGTNIIKLLERQKNLLSKEETSPYELIFIFSDRSDGLCHGEKIAHENGIPYFSYDIRTFHRLRGLKRSVGAPQGLSARKAFDQVARRLVRAFDIDVIALGGYMSYTTLNRCVNVHPADLSILTAHGERKYVGDQAVLEAVKGGESVIRASTLWTDQGVDTGPLLMVSPPLEVKLPESVEILLKDRKRLNQIALEHQNRLKEIGDWKIFPRTVEMIARGRFALDELNRVHVDGHPVPEGYRE